MPLYEIKLVPERETLIVKTVGIVWIEDHTNYYHSVHKELLPLIVDVTGDSRVFSVKMLSAGYTVQGVFLVLLASAGLLNQRASEMACFSVYGDCLLAVRPNMRAL